MFKLYYASAIDACPEKALQQIREFKQLFAKYDVNGLPWGEMLMKVEVRNPIEVYGAGFGHSPIITPESTDVYKGILSSYDKRILRDCDVLLVVTDLKQFCAGTMMEFEYARNLGIYTIVLCLAEEKCKNISIETYANKIIYSKKELEEILKDLTQ
jgi:hypothetical protein